MPHQNSSSVVLAGGIKATSRKKGGGLSLELQRNGELVFIVPRRVVEIFIFIALMEVKALIACGRALEARCR